ncbi:MAG: RHS repeat-associated core domain-containing protein [Planctomycetota bacterium]
MPTTNYVWDPLNDSYLMETDGAGATTAVYTQEPLQYGGLTSQHQASVTSNFLQDHLGSTRLLTDDAGTVMDTFTYDAWGSETARSGTGETPLRWGGQLGYYFDPELNSYYIRRRNFRSDLAQWLSPDPAGFIDGINRFVYQGVPRGIDPSGLSVRDFNPTEAKDMPWCEVGCRGGYGLPDQIQDEWFRQKRPREKPDLDGLYDGVYGRTTPLFYDVVCTCDCVDPCSKTYDLRCTVRAYFRMRIAPSNFKPTMGIDGVYGHEQRHIANLIEGADIWAAAADKAEALNKGVSQSTCESAATGFAFVANGSLINWIIREAKHQNPKGPEDGRSNYGPIGSRPAKPDCSKPGSPSKIKPGKRCDGSESPLTKSPELPKFGDE